MRKLSTNPNVDNSDLVNYPDGRIKNNDGSGNGTPVNERVYGDIHQTIAKLMRLYGIIPNDLPDNETNGFQIVDALIALASKNDYILPLSVDTGVLQVPIKLGAMKENEAVICLSGFNYTAETQIKGSDNATFALTNLGVFKTGNYVRLIKTALGVTLVRIADNVSLDDMNTILLYLKKASQTQENAGAIDTVATTPLSNLTAFIRRVNGLDSGSYLATALRNGIYPKEHFEIVAGIGASPIKNSGWVSGINVGMPATSLPRSGDISSANLTSNGLDSFIVCTMANAMSNTNYLVKTYVEGQSSNIDADNDICQVIFKPLNTTQFQLALRQVTVNNQNLKIHIKVEQLT